MTVVKDFTLEDPIASAMQRAISAEEEVAALRQQHVLLKDFCEKEKEQNSRQQKQIEQLKKALEDAEKRVLELQTVEKRFHKNTNRQSELELSLVKEKEAHQALKAEKENAEKLLAETQQHNKQLERVIQFLRERTDEAALEVKQLRTEFQTAQETIKSLTQQYQATKEESILLSQRLSEEQSNYQDAVSQQKHVIALLNAELATLRQDKRQLEEALEQAKVFQEEHSIEAKVAQQHLTKKMKEIAILNEKIEEQKVHILELNHSCSDAQTKVANLEEQMEIQRLHEQRIQEQLQENVKAAEAQLKKWEDKYFIIHDRLQAAELEIKSLKLLENKHQQMQTLMTNFGALLGITSTLSQQKQATIEVTPNEESPKKEQYGSH